MSHSPDQTALVAAFRRLLAPMAQLALSRGLPYSALDELLRQVLVDVAADAQGPAAGHGQVSRISTATGLSRREVSRLLDLNPDRPGTPRWLAGEVFARWTTDPGYAHQGRPNLLPRKGEGVSFETLAQSVTRDVHPRSLLDELCRLGLAEVVQDGDGVRLIGDAFVPRQDFTRMVALLADNVGDHLHSAVHNVLGSGEPFLEQAVYADELSESSVQALRPVVQAQWHALRQALVPVLEQLIEADAKAGRSATQRVRIGLYSASAPMDAAGAAGAGGVDQAS